MPKKPSAKEREFQDETERRLKRVQQIRARMAEVPRDLEIQEIRQEELVKLDQALIQGKQEAAAVHGLTIQDRSR